MEYGVRWVSVLILILIFIYFENVSENPHTNANSHDNWFVNSGSTVFM